MVASTPLADIADFTQVAFLGGSNLIDQFDYDANGNLIYHGWAQSGSNTTDSTWRIVQISYNSLNQPISTGYPNSNPSFSFQWSARTTYAYS